MSIPTHAQTYASRAQKLKNPAGKALLEVMERKQSNLCVSVDVTSKKDLLDVVKSVAKFVCLVKTHIDIVSDFDQDLIDQLVALSKAEDFLIFEDRKFADIGNTVSLQYGAGVHKIASWAHITNAHLVPGPGIIDGLRTVGEPLQRGLLLLAEMSSKGTLAKGDYSQECVKAARANQDFVFGFIAMHRVQDDDLVDSAVPVERDAEDFLVLTPGVGLDVSGDAMGQQYRTPQQVIGESKCDVIIVGRGIYGALLKSDDRASAIEQVRKQGERYRVAGWQAYEQRLTGA
ncbi:orotidine-5'-phosphate decarboxylase [Ceraceosorus guamensis]|uniref:Orotidine 5'-phosphate decarboxylase n=1 Tax=Ceraceosorus guamensis TaxID=1522189 RepID=A0A316W786_9BASI|nr:orotidine-5'-phosphate decarboxylase [Ceraceosorus guamensis]PWN43505.1 orotidine-5'-phosphate decarboxylase [Ceraceosorus guamensis]